MGRRGELEPRHLRLADGRSTAKNTDMTCEARLSSLVDCKGSQFLSQRARKQREKRMAEDSSKSPAAHQTSWEPRLAQRIRENLSSRQTEKGSSPYLVALVGIPGSGKSVSALLLANMLEESGFNCMVMPHDGYHYSIEMLETFPDAEDAIYRRGAPDTFDPETLLRDLARIRENHDEELIKLPAFDHSKGDPEPGKHVFDRHRHRVVICEGLYLLHDKDGWEPIANMFDLRIFMNADVDSCIERLKVRNLCIPGYTPEEINIRCEKVDRTNALTVDQSKSRADVVVDSIASAPPPSKTLAATTTATHTSDLDLAQKA